MIIAAFWCRPLSTGTCLAGVQHLSRRLPAIPKAVRNRRAPNGGLPDARKREEFAGKEPQAGQIGRAHRASAIVIAPIADLYWSINGGGNMDSLHDLLATTLQELGRPAPANLIQTMLLKDRYFVGYKFRYEGGYAIMQADSGTVELYDEEGRLLKRKAAA
jgi:hypothetical protein